MKAMQRPIVAAALAAVLALPACAPLVVGGIAAGTALVATDRRSTGAQVDDKTIEMRLSNELATAVGAPNVRISVNSFERKVLLTGEVPNEDVKARAGRIASNSLNVRAVANELAIAPPSTLGQRTDDATLGGRVRASFINTREIPFNSVDIVTDRGVIYLMGLVTEREGEIAATVASRVPGVRQVVKVFDYASAEEVQRRRTVGSAPPPPPPASSSPAPITAPAPTVTPGTAPR